MRSAENRPLIASKPTLPAAPPMDAAKLAAVARHLQRIIEPRTGRHLGDRVCTLVDVMQHDGAIPMELQQAAQRFRELYMIAEGPSQGVSSYGDGGGGGKPWSKMLTTDQRLRAGHDLKSAALAAFGVVDSSGRWSIDEALMACALPAILSDHKGVTQGAIGRDRTRYTGPAQVRAAGGTVVAEVLHRLARHFGYVA